MLVDSNIIIYLRDPLLGPQVAAKIGDGTLATCNVIVAEVLGFGGLNPDDAQLFSELFGTMKNCDFDNAVTQQVIKLRRSIRIELPDAIIAATALVHDLVLCTHNFDDFKMVPGLRLFDPLDER